MRLRVRECGLAKGIHLSTCAILRRLKGITHPLLSSPARVASLAGGERRSDFDILQFSRMSSETNKAKAARFGISESYFYQLKRAGVDVHDDAELGAAIVGKEATGDAQRLLKARADRAEAAAERERHALDVEQGKYVSRESVEKDSIRIGHLLKSRLVQLACHEMPPQLAGLDASAILKILDLAIFNVLNEIADELEKVIAIEAA